MTFNDIYNLFIKSTKENFPVESCTKQDKKNPKIFYSEKAYLCLIINKQFSSCWDYWQIAILYPYIYKESKYYTRYGWIDKNKNIKGNIENSAQLYREFVVAIRDYEENESDVKLWNGFIYKIRNEIFER